jgi:DNA-binding beta-propeller fold protein YncE
MNERPNAGATAGRSDEPDRLESWKEIAAYLNRDVRTVQRWERTEGLPVQRHRHGERGSVFAVRSEIDAWRNARQTPPAADNGGQPRRLRQLTALAGLIVLAAWLGPGRRQPAPAPDSGRAPGDAPRLLDALTRDGGNVRTFRTVRGAHAIALANGDRELYVASSVTGSAAVVDTATLRVSRSFELRDPSVVVSSPDGNTVFIGQSVGDVLVIDVRTKETYKISVDGQVRGLAVSPDNKKLYIAATYAGLFVADLATRAVRPMSNLPCPAKVATAPDGSLLYVNYQCNGPGGRRGHDAVDVIDTATGKSIGAITGLANVGGEVAVSPDGSRLWIDGSDACSTRSYDGVGCPSVPAGIINVVRSSDRSPLRALALSLKSPGGTSSRLTFTPDGTRVAVTYETGMRVYNAATLETVERLDRDLASGPVASGPVFSRDGTAMYLGTDDQGTVSVVPIAARPMPPRGLRGRWTADGTPNDTQTLSHGEFDGDVKYAPGYVGAAFLLDGRSGHIRVDGPWNAGLASRANFTLAFWVHGASGAPVNAELAELAPALPVGEAAAGWRLGLTAGGRLSACFSDGIASCDVDAPQRTAHGRIALKHGWHHVALTWDGVTARVYLDGRLDGERALPGFVGADRAPLRLGDGFAGRLDEIEAYERALTADEIAARARAR